MLKFDERNLRVIGTYILEMANLSSNDSFAENGSARHNRNRQSGDMQFLTALARSEYAHRRQREKVLPQAIFGEPAWDLLLDLYANDLDNKTLSIKSACIASSAPMTTALRWINALEQAGLVARANDSSDRRRQILSITDMGRHQMRLVMLSKWSQELAGEFMLQH